MKYIDFHMHTHYSDGSINPIELIRKTKENGLDAVAITDHDNFRGYYGAFDEAKRLGIQLIPGTEITAEKYHILGLGVNFKDKRFIEFLEKSRELQINNTKRTVKNLQEIGLQVYFEDVANYFPEGARLGSFNVILYLAGSEKAKKYFFEKGITCDLKKAYQYVRPHKDERESVTPKETIEEIKRAGGIAIIAHPAKDIGDLTTENQIQELKQLIDLGLDGVEIQPNFMERGYRNYIDYANKNNLLITYGSDHHKVAMGQRPILKRGENIVTDEFLRRLVRN